MYRRVEKHINKHAFTNLRFPSLLFFIKKEPASSIPIIKNGLFGIILSIGKSDIFELRWKALL